MSRTAPVERDTWPPGRRAAASARPHVGPRCQL